MKIHFRASVVSLLAFVWCSFSQAQPVASPTVIERKSAIPAEFFGLVVQRAHMTTKWPSVPFGAWRIWDSYLKWADIQPAPGVWNFESFDRQVSLGLQNEKELTYTLGQTARWASVSGDEKHAWGMGTGGMPKRMEDWKSYVEAVVTRYKGRIKVYEVWNEPKYSDALGRCRGAIFFCGKPDDLVKLAAVAHEVIKRVDPAARLATPGFTDSIRGAAALDAYLSAGGARYTDIASFHFYELHPEKGWETAQEIKRVLAKNGLANVPIWNTEVGYLVQTRAGEVKAEWDVGPFSRVFSPAEAGARMARVHIVAASAGVERVFWYAWDSKHMGMIDPADQIPNQMTVSYRVVRRWLVGATISCGGRPVMDTWQCDVSNSGRTAKLVWKSEIGQTSLLLPGTGPRLVEGLDESRAQAKGGAIIPWDGAPVLVVSDGKPWYFSR